MGKNPLGAAWGLVGGARPTPTDCPTPLEGPAEAPSVIPVGDGFSFYFYTDIEHFMACRSAAALEQVGIERPVVMFGTSLTTNSEKIFHCDIEN